MGSSLQGPGLKSLSAVYILSEDVPGNSKFKGSAHGLVSSTANLTTCNILHVDICKDFGLGSFHQSSRIFSTGRAFKLFLPVILPCEGLLFHDKSRHPKHQNTNPKPKSLHLPRH